MPPRPARNPSDLDLVVRHAEQLAVQRVREGDSLALEMIFTAFRAELLALAEGVSGSHEVAEDVLQEVFLAIWKGRDRWRVTVSLRGYLRRAVQNSAARWHSSRTRSGGAGVSLEARESAGLELVDPSPSPADETAYGELSAAVDAATSALPPRARDVFTLSRDEQLSNREIADRLGVSVKTVETHMTRALRVLRRRLGRWRDDG